MVKWISYTQTYSLFFWLLDFYIFLIEGKLLYSVVLVSAIQQCESVIIICIHISAPSWTSPHLTLLGYHKAGLSALHPTANSHWLSVLHMVYVLILLSQFAPPSPSTAMSTHLFSTSVSLLLHYKVHQYHFSRFHIYALIYNISFSLSYFTLNNRLQVHPPRYSWLKFVPLCGWVIFHCICVLLLLSSFSHVWLSATP